jgi:hypothetical protein
VRAQTAQLAGRGTGGKLKNWQAEGQAGAQTAELAGRGTGGSTDCRVGTNRQKNGRKDIEEQGIECQT